MERYSCTPWQYCRIYVLDFPISATTTGIYKATGGRQPSAAKHPCKYIYNDDRCVVYGLEESFLDQIWSHKRNLLAMRSTLRRAVCSPCFTFLASPDSAGGSPGRDPLVSRRGLLFSFFLQIVVPISSIHSCL